MEMRSGRLQVFTLSMMSIQVECECSLHLLSAAVAVLIHVLDHDTFINKLGFVQLKSAVRFKSCFVKGLAAREVCLVGAVPLALPCGPMPCNADIASNTQYADTR